MTKWINQQPLSWDNAASTPLEDFERVVATVNRITPAVQCHIKEVDDEGRVVTLVVAAIGSTIHVRLDDE